MLTDHQRALAKFGGAGEFARLRAIERAAWHALQPARSTP